jgi:hypothetical protein
LLASKYVREFEQKWIGGEPPPDESLIGSSDIQTLGDLSTSFNLVRGMSAVPFSKYTVIGLCIITLSPLVPLVLTMVPFEELLKGLINVLA